MDAGSGRRPSRFRWCDPRQAGGRTRAGGLVFP